MYKCDKVSCMIYVMCVYIHMYVCMHIYVNMYESISRERESAHATHIKEHQRLVHTHTHAHTHTRTHTHHTRHLDAL